MTGFRPAAVAGTFYPDDARRLTAVVDTLLDEATAAPAPVPRALIVPHAGYVYSGPVAASAYARLRPFAARYRQVLLLGPSHFLPLTGLARSGAEAFRTPLGDVPVDRDACAPLGSDAVTVSEPAHDREHSVEVQLPFLQRVLDEFTVAPLVVGEAAPEFVAELIDSFLDRPDALVVVSSDLSHYLPYDAARCRDRATCRAVEALDGTAIGPEQACGAAPLRGLLLAARRRSMDVMTLDLRNSGDTAGGRDQVVGYGAWLLAEGEGQERAG